MKQRILLTVAYDGTAYHGWQVQPNATTIAGVLNETLSDLCGEPIEVQGGSRTDAGVHALGNVTVFDTDAPIPAEKFAYAINARLPEDIRVQASRAVPADFHPRHCASRKRYVYKIYTAPVSLPTERLYSLHIHRPCAIEPMREAAKFFVGEHDFAGFCSARSQAEDTVRLVEDVTISQEGPFILIFVTGRGFLYNMVRIMAGTLLEVGYGNIAPTEIPSILAACDRNAAGPTAPAKGLTLLGYDFFI